MKDCKKRKSAGGASNGVRVEAITLVAGASYGTSVFVAGASSGKLKCLVACAPHAFGAVRLVRWSGMHLVIWLSMTWSSMPCVLVMCALCILVAHDLFRDYLPSASSCYLGAHASTRATPWLHVASLVLCTAAHCLAYASAPIGKRLSCALTYWQTTTTRAHVVCRIALALAHRLPSCHFLGTCMNIHIVMILFVNRFCLRLISST
ncbi:hypothetical protein Salat_1063200 [Sesamum alatum]|uniref:Uncharacterized protein n=1 Tax=Sesamum alatum TaxID=300844 RepID=A0AAE2CSM5_9LAMI|nr:hypothetical protein Salat_1063200 [Sesamum alatum]